MSTMPPALVMNAALPPVLAEETRYAAGVGGDRCIAGGAPLEEVRPSTINDGGIASRGRATPKKTRSETQFSGAVLHRDGRMISRARILEKNGPAIHGGGDCRITCLARILKFDVRSPKSCDLRISSRAAAPEEYETAREAKGICDGVTTCKASVDCRATSVAIVKKGDGTCIEGV